MRGRKRAGGGRRRGVERKGGRGRGREGEMKGRGEGERERGRVQGKGRKGEGVRQGGRRREEEGGEKGEREGGGKGRGKEGEKERGGKGRWQRWRWRGRYMYICQYCTVLADIHVLVFNFAPGVFQRASLFLAGGVP